MQSASDTEALRGKGGYGVGERRREGQASSLESNWGWFAIRGVLALIFGILALIMPSVAVMALTVVLGIYLLGDGIASVVIGIRHARRTAERWWSLVLRGLLGIVAGVAMLLMPVAVSVALVLFTWLVLAAWALLGGIAEVAAAMRLRREEGRMAWWLLAAGVFSIALGVAIPFLLAANPQAGLWAMGVTIAAYAIAAGIALLALAFKLRRAARAFPSDRIAGGRHGQPGLA